MEAAEIIQKTRQGVVGGIDRDELATLLESSETIRAVDTCFSGWIRILAFDGRVAAQEETPDGEILLRGFASLEDAEAFVDNRLAIYDRMWDGCGCKVDYRE